RSEVSRGNFLLGAVQQALGEGDIGRILAGPADVFLGRRDGRLHLAGARLDRRRLIKRLPARIAVRPAVRDVGFAERAAGHGSPMGCPSDMEGDDSFECRVSGYKSRVFGILPDNYMARTASERLSEKLQYAPRLPSARSDRLRGILGCARWRCGGVVRSSA